MFFDQRKLLYLLLVYFAIADRTGMVYASESDLRINGFAKLGMSVSDNRHVYDEDVQDRANYFYGNRLGLNVSKQLSEDWNIAAQLLALGDHFNYDVKADWFFASYTPAEWLTLKFGQQKSQIWLFSEYLDVGVAYPWVEPPEEVYSLDPLRTFGGISAASKLYIKNYQFTFDPFFGGVDAEFDQPQFSRPTRVVSSDYHGLIMTVSNDNAALRGSYGSSTISVPNFAIEDWGIQFWSAGLSLDWNGLLFFSEYAVTMEKSSSKKKAAAEEYTTAKDSLEQGIAQLEAAQEASAAGGDAAAAEVYGMQKQQAQQQLGELMPAWVINTNKVFGHRAYYACLAYHWRAFTPHYTLAHVKAPSSQLILSGDQQTHTLGIKYDVTDSMAFKLDLQKIRIASGKKGLYDYNAEGVIPDGISNTLMTRLSLDIVF